MFNDLNLIGKITEIVDEKEKERSVVGIAVQRPFRNENFEYDYDYIPLTFKAALRSCTDILKKDMQIAVKGVVQREKGEELTILVTKCVVLSRL